MTQSKAAWLVGLGLLMLMIAGCGENLREQCQEENQAAKVAAVARGPLSFHELLVYDGQLVVELEDDICGIALEGRRRYVCLEPQLYASIVDVCAEKKSYCLIRLDCIAIGEKLSHRVRVLGQIEEGLSALGYPKSSQRQNTSPASVEKPVEAGKK